MINKALSLINKCLETNDFVLRLSNCQIDDHDLEPDSIFYNALKRCTHVKILNLSENNINTVKGLENLTQVQSLDLSYNSIKEIKNIGKLTNLNELALQKIQIKEIAGIERLLNLTKLSLYGNLIEKIKGLDALINLKSLLLGSNKISKIQGLENLTQLNLLYIGNNRIKSITGLEKLVQLERLHLNNNLISVTTGIGNLSQLIELDLSHNQITNLNGLEGLTLLERLYLNKNLISNTNNLRKLTKLQVLNLSNNEVVNVRALVPLLKQNSADLKNNPKPIAVDSKKKPIHNSPIPKNFRINDSSPKSSVSPVNYVFVNRPTSIKLDLENNPLTTPPIEIAEQGNNAILNFFETIDIQGIEYLYEAKMLIVGQPRAGKTSLRYKLLNIKKKLPTEDKTTRGIDIESSSFEVKDTEGNYRKFSYNIWDFGGQHIYHTTHQFFLTHRSLYLLVLDTARDTTGNDDTSINYWLQIIELLGGNSPLLLIRNEKNERQINIDISQKKARFKFLKGDYTVDLNALIKGTKSFNTKRLNDFNYLKDDIENELRHLPLVGFAMPKNWIKIRISLQELSLRYPYILRNEFIEICNSNSVNKFQEQMELSRIFHDLGVFLHFQDYTSLEDIIILQNTWATDAVFAVLDNPLIQSNKGKFTENDVFDIWKSKNYDVRIYKKLLYLMIQFELCYQVSKEKPFVYIIPELLADSPPKGYSWVQSNDLMLYYKYDFMPKGVLTKLIVRLHNYIAEYNQNQLVWKTGVKIDGNLLMCIDTFAEITETWDNEQLFIRIQGAMSRELMSKLTFYIDELNNELFRPRESDIRSQKSKWHKLIPCNCETCFNSEKKHFHDYTEILKRIEYGKTTIECKMPPHFFSVNISELIDGVFATLKNNYLLKGKTLNGQSIKVFVASSSELEPEREKFEIFIRRENERLSRKGILIELVIWEYFIDAMSQKKMQDEYNKAIAECDIFVMMFFSKVGKYTLEEFENAFKYFKETNRPQIYTYFLNKNIKSSEIKRDDINSMLDFQDRLKELGHYYKTVTDSPDLHLNFNWQLGKLYGI